MDKILEQFPQEMRGYIISQLDPFHDSDYRIEGAPSSLNSASVVLTCKAERTLSAADFPFIFGSTFDLNIASFPISNYQNLTGCNRAFGNTLSRLQSAVDSYEAIYPLTISAAESGTPTFTFVDSDGPRWTGLGVGDPLQYVTPDGVSYRRSRLIGQAFEAIDVTPEIYRQGSVTVYKQPSTSLDETYNCVNLWNGATAQKVMPLQRAKTISVPPLTAATAVRLAGSRTWPAREGAYVVSERCDGETPFLQPDNTAIFLKGANTFNGSLNNFKNGYPSTWRQDMWDTQSKTVVTENVTGPENVNSAFPYNVSGAFFQGLSTQYSTLRLRLIQFWEVIPTTDDVSLVPLTTPTLPMDYNLETLLQKVMATQPAGWMASDNPKGEVWRRIARIAGSIIKESAPLVSLVNPELGVATQISGQALQAMGRQKGKKKAIASTKNYDKNVDRIFDQKKSGKNKSVKQN